MEEDRKFKGIWIPKEIWLSEELTLQEKVLLVEIDSLEDEEKGCYASNNYFANFFKLSPGRISQLITNLTNKGYINVVYIYKGKEIERREMKINRPPYPVFSKLNTCLENCDRGIKNTKEGYLENAKENNTSINNKEIYKEIIDYLNEIAGKKYRHTDSTIKLIKARLNEGFTVEDFKKVIDKKTKDWKNDSKMKDYLRPQTLFSNKFEGYLNQEDKRMSGFMGYMEEFYGKENNS